MCNEYNKHRQYEIIQFPHFYLVPFNYSSHADTLYRPLFNLS